jgi:hypothetical protein
MKSSFRHPSAHFESRLGALIDRIAFQSGILQKIRAALPEELAEHAVHCLLKPGSLIIFTDSSAWAAKLRFHQPTIVAALGDRLTPDATKFQVKLLSHLESKAEARSALVPSKKVIENILTTAEATGDPQLKEALTRLSDRLNRVRTKE